MTSLKPYREIGMVTPAMINHFLDTKDVELYTLIYDMNGGPKIEAIKNASYEFLRTADLSKLPLLIHHPSCMVQEIVNKRLAGENKS